VTNLCRWQDFYTRAGGPMRFGGEASYRLAASFLKDCASIEDWGAGACWLRQYVYEYGPPGRDHPPRYVSIDGSGPHVDVLIDLVDYHSECEGICLRHVLEHDENWQIILGNALESFRKRLIIVLSTGLEESDTELSFNERIGVPNIALCRGQVQEILAGYSHTILEFGHETAIFVSADGVEHKKAVAVALKAAE
jgi:hypothetical protein